MEQVISGGLILAGAAIMLVSMIKWRQLSQVTRSEEHTSELQSH